MKKNLSFCLLCLMISCISLADPPSDDIAPTRSAILPGIALYTIEKLQDDTPHRRFLDRPIEEVKADILAAKDINDIYPYEFGYVPILVYAAEVGTPEILEFLLKNAADPDNIGKHPRRAAMHAAIVSHRIDSIKILLKYGADPNLKWNDKKPIDEGVYRYTDVLYNEIYRKHIEKPLKPETLKTIVELKQTYIEIMKLLLPITTIEKENLTRWRKNFDMLLHAVPAEVKLTESEVDKEWKLFLDLIRL